MSENSHTPGPWHVSSGHGVYTYAYHAGINPEMKTLVATSAYTAHRHFKGEEEANLNLIASASEMLGALDRLLEWWDHDKSWSPEIEIEAARAAVKKARGA
jgi:hypothetical protein